jgi:dTDP-4-amino-4,6-dideoxygalactose transaminase
VTTDTLAILGGTAAFPNGLRQLKPTLPPWDSVGPRWERCFATGSLTKGDALREYERRLAEHLGVRHAIAVSSCTAGLMLVFDRFRGRRVVLPSFTFMATAMAASWAALDLVFCDVHPETWSLDPASVEAAIARDSIGPENGVIVPVHVFGTPADTDAFTAISERTGIPVVYDAAHGFGALRRGAPVGREGLAQVFSTSPTKLLITGEGGVVATDDDATAEHVDVGREYGNPGDYNAVFAGFNARLAESNALLGSAGLDLLEGEAVRRNELAGIYQRELGPLPGITFQRIDPEDRCSYKDISITVDAAGFGLSRDELVAVLAADGIPTRAYYDPPAHRLTAFAGIGPAFEDRLPVTARLAGEIVSLPLYGALADADVERVCGCARGAHERASDVRAALART